MVLDFEMAKMILYVFDLIRFYILQIYLLYVYLFFFFCLSIIIYY